MLYLMSREDALELQSRSTPYQVFLDFIIWELNSEIWKRAKYLTAKDEFAFDGTISHHTLMESSNQEERTRACLEIEDRFKDLGMSVKVYQDGAGRIGYEVRMLPQQEVKSDTTTAPRGYRIIAHKDQPTQSGDLLLSFKLKTWMAIDPSEVGLNVSNFYAVCRRVGPDSPCAPLVYHVPTTTIQAVEKES